MKIGITIDASLSVKNSTVNQSIIFMADLLTRAGHECSLLTNRRSVTRWTKHTVITVSPHEAPLIPFEICIEAGFQFGPDAALKLKEKNPKCKFIRFYFEDQSLRDSLAITTPPSPVNDRVRGFDEVWTYDHLTRTIPYLEALHQCRAKTVPLIWDSQFINKEISILKKKGTSAFYSPDKKNTVCILEENKNYHSTCLIPLAICERLNQSHPDIIHKVNVTNCGAIKKTQRFHELKEGMPICNNDPQKVFFNNKWNNIQALSRWGKVVISNNTTGDPTIRHLEYAYLEFPLLHNAYAIKDFGYYYDAESISNATNQLRYALTMHDDNLNYYKGLAKECLNRFSGFNQKNIDLFSRII